ncbi:hypothetical protein [Leifsonia sp. RAF41]|uniref:hypothetical protein n=1 Tax=Leifsonia sp. RAF41 TaxID=3233056 RepID=UPI003F962933
MADALLAEATELELQYGEAVRSSDWTDRDTTGAVYQELTRATLRALRTHEAAWSSILVYATVKSATSRIARVEESTPEGETAEMDLPRSLLDYWSLGQGDGLWLFCQIRESSAFFEVLPTAQSQVDHLERQAFLRSLSPERTEREKQRLRRLASTEAVGRRAVRKPVQV